MNLALNLLAGKDDKHMRVRKPHFSEDVVRKLQRPYELAGRSMTGEEVAAELGVSAPAMSMTVAVEDLLS